MSRMGPKSKYPWNEVNRLQLVQTVKVVKSEGKKDTTKWKEVVRRFNNDSEDLEDSMFSKLCSKQFDNLNRAYTKYKQDGDQPPRLTDAIIEEFDELFPGMATVVKAVERDRMVMRGSLDTKSTKSSSPDAATQQQQAVVASGKNPRLSWSNVDRLDMITAIRGAASTEGKIYWSEVAGALQNDFGVNQDRLCTLCMKQFTDLSFRYKEFKMAGVRPERLTFEIIQKLDELFEEFPNLNPLPNGGQDLFVDNREEASKDRIVSSPPAAKDEVEDREEVSKDGMVSSPAPSKDDVEDRDEVSKDRMLTSPAVSEDELDNKSSSKQDEVAAESTPDSEPCSGSREVPEDETGREEDEIGREEDETPPPGNEMTNLGKRKERADISSSQTDMLSHEDNDDDDQDVGFDRLEKELLQLKPWLKQEVLPVGREVLARVKAYGRKHQIGKRNKRDDFDKLIFEASQKSTVLAIRAQFQQARANILKEVQETIERVGMDLLAKRSSSFGSTQGRLPGQSQDGPSGSG